MSMNVNNNLEVLTNKCTNSNNINSKYNDINNIFESSGEQYITNSEEQSNSVFMNINKKTEIQENFKAEEHYNHILNTKNSNLKNNADELNNALQEAEEEMKVFKDVIANANGKAEDITSKTIDKVFSDIEAKVFEKGAKITKNTIRENGFIFKEYSDGTKLCYKSGESVEFYKDLRNGYFTGGLIKTSEGNKFQEDEAFIFVSNKKTDNEDNDRSNRYSASYKYNLFNTDKFSVKSDAVVLDGLSDVKGNIYTKFLTI